MSKEIIINWLWENNPKKYTAAQIVYFLKSDELSESVIYANLKKLRAVGEVNWEWGTNLNEKSRPARYYFYKKEANDG